MSRRLAALTTRAWLVCLQAFTPSQHTHTHTVTHTQSHSHTHAHTLTHTVTHTLTHTHAHTLTYTHTHARARAHWLVRLQASGLRVPVPPQRVRLASLEERVAEFAKGVGTVLVDADNVRGKVRGNPFAWQPLCGQCAWQP